MNTEHNRKHTRKSTNKNSNAFIENLVTIRNKFH